ncbi:MAG: hypothetical protein AB7T31_17820 [Gemmatimonadales bacterium]
MNRVVRGLLGLGTIGALTGGVFVAALATVVELIGGGAVVPGVIGTFFLAGAGLGFAVTTAFGAVLAVTSRGRAMEDVSFWRATIASAVVGALLPLVIVLIGGDAVSARLAEAPAILISGLFGAFLGGGLVGLAKRGRQGEIEDGKGDRKLVEK